MGLSSNLIHLSGDRDSSVLSINSVFGVAVFDLNGLPKTYFKTEETPNMTWIQTTFQVLGLRSLAAPISAGAFHHLVIHGQNYSVLIVQQSQSYVAFLLPLMQPVPTEWIEWARTIDPDCFSEVDRFQVA